MYEAGDRGDVRGRLGQTGYGEFWSVCSLYHEDAWDSPDRDHCRLKIKQKMATVSMKSPTTITTFKAHLKTELFAAAYDSV